MRSVASRVPPFPEGDALLVDSVDCSTWNIAAGSLSDAGRASRWDPERVADAEWTFTTTIRSSFFRAVNPAFRELALAGSRSAGRYSRAHEPTLYLSSSIAGVNAAMIAHRGARAERLDVVRVEVEAQGIIDLRDTEVLRAIGIDVADAVAPWQDDVAAGRSPRSWAVRNRALEVGAAGLIDPSRRDPGQWHLVLFRWNDGDAPSVRLGDSDTVEAR